MSWMEKLKVGDFVAVEKWRWDDKSDAEIITHNTVERIYDDGDIKLRNDYFPTFQNGVAKKKRTKIRSTNFKLIKQTDDLVNEQGRLKDIESIRMMVYSDEIEVMDYKKINRIKTFLLSQGLNKPQSWIERIDQMENTEEE